jgi:hypothetical protein
VKRAVLIATGVVLVLLGVLLIGAGGATAALFGSDGSLSTAPARVSGSGVALVVEDISIDASSIPVPEGVGTLTLTVSDAQGGAMFVGSASGEAVDTYLTGAPYDVVVAVSAGSDATTRPVPGTQQPPPPTTQSFWTRQATGSPAELTARVSSATTLVVMNADATPGVDADLVVTLTVARAWSAAWIAVGVGVLLLLLSILAFWRAKVAGRRAREAAAAAAPPVATPVAAAPGATILPGSEPVLPVAAVAVAADAAPDPVPAAAAPEAAVAVPPEVVDPADAPTALIPATVAEPAPVEAAPADPLPVEAAIAAAPSAYDAGTGSADAPEPEQAASPVDMDALFAPVADDATAVLPAVSAEPGTAASEAPDAATTGPVAPAETQHPAG